MEDKNSKRGSRFTILRENIPNQEVLEEDLVKDQEEDAVLKNNNCEDSKVGRVDFVPKTQLTSQSQTGPSLPRPMRKLRRKKFSRG